MEEIRFIFKLKRNIIFFLGTALVFGSMGCSSRPCREPRLPELDRTKSGASTAAAPPDTVATKKSLGDDGLAASVRVRIYKPDGSRQCEKKAGISLETMERELAGITVHLREKKKDGLMHIQVCGSPTGEINIFEIDSSFLKQAEQRGFKRLED